MRCAPLKTVENNKTNDLRHFIMYDSIFLLFIFIQTKTCGRLGQNQQNSSSMKSSTGRMTQINYSVSEKYLFISCRFSIVVVSSPHFCLGDFDEELKSKRFNQKTTEKKQILFLGTSSAHRPRKRQSIISHKMICVMPPCMQTKYENE